MVGGGPRRIATTRADLVVWRCRGLRYVVLDEAHAYTGVFGCHVGLVLRRLIRACHYHGASPQFICCSARRTPCLYFAYKALNNKDTLNIKH